ncbi:MAG: hypothetical protein AUG14_05615 [Candidatus Rokubacteria bacterium 13_1_20CM_2_68_19]|nr:MAG: hypothetical protein AUH18_02745 [Candidatus Rokubacteria bacterium 13_2_20CM_69_10]OLB42074.1 MAG: hypothetical protein AUI04_05685 [Candidatus Rokubacteria bacterium 13_2_20CM_2_64_8]OLD99337.1 MAG: hypothetical protein AUG80_05830 [Candidatus Rokubacteria bacterium 13_1_20CM_4_68_9]OLE44241.1 MAG: hypothetical protein AUG14_05615 [Candidatus Rokubacteria bacterium 13_1_20CM_2_68_19]
MIALLLIAIALIAALSGPVTPSADAADSKGPKTLLGSIFGSSGRQDGHEEEERLDPDRPHFPEATTTVGKGRVILESGYTFTEKRSSFSSQTYPEALLRVGMFAEWFEFRIGQNFLRQEQTVAGTTTRESGAQDLYLGVKLALIEQDGYVPQIALIPQMTVPTGSKGVTAGRVLPGVNVDFSWEIVKDLFDVELLIATNSVADGNLESHVEVATGLTAAVALTRKLQAFVEWDAFYPVGSGGADTGTRHYAVGGLIYFFTKNLAVDVRAGVGLNRQANDVIAGTGFAVRY